MERRSSSRAGAPAGRRRYHWSDDLAGARLFELYADGLRQGKKYMGLLDMYFLELASGRLCCCVAVLTSVLGAVQNAPLGAVATPPSCAAQPD